MSSLGRCSRNASAARLRGATHPAKLVVGELVKLVDEADLDAACIFVVAPSTVIHARYLCVKLRAQLPNLKIAIGLWSATENITQAAERLRDSGANEVVTTLADAVVQLAIIGSYTTKLRPTTTCCRRYFSRLALLCRRANLLQKKILSDDAARLIFSESAGPRQCDGVKEKRSAGGTTSEHSTTSRG